MEQNTDRMGFALIALSIVAVVLIIMNTFFGPTVKGYFQGLQKWSNTVTNQLNPPQQYTHTAYAWSADGKDRFSTIKPNLNLFTGTSDKPSTKTGGNWNYKDIGVYKTPKVGQEYTVSVEVPDADHDVVLEVRRWDNAGQRVDWLAKKQMKSGEKTHVTFTWPDPGNSGATQIAAALVWTNGSDTGTYSYSKAKLEQGSTATSWMPSQSEATSADGPTYIGTYTDTNEQGSQDPTKYTWTKTN